MRFAFYGRVSTEDAQDPTSSRAWQKRRAQDLIRAVEGDIVAEYFDIGQSRSLPWKRRPETSRLLADLADPERGWNAVVIGEPARAFYGGQFALTFPIFTHYRVQLWVPEVGGAVDPGSEAHDLVMTLFGGLSKGERTRIRLRVRTALEEMASTTDRFLGGRPPYGYMLVDAGPHPTSAKATMGQRLHRLEPDPVTAPVVRRIFAMFVDDVGLRMIADTLTREEIPSPSAYDRARNSHRDPRGWSHSAVRAILANPIYGGKRMWGKQRRHEDLLDVDDVAAGYVTRMRWQNTADWIESPSTHKALVDDETAKAAIERFGRRPERPRQRTSKHPYVLRGILHCNICGRKLQGSARPTKNGPARILYRCEFGKSRSAPVGLDHPSTFYVREESIVEVLDKWLSEIVTPESLAQAQHRPPELASQDAATRARIAECDTRIPRLLASIEDGMPSDWIADRVVALRTERAQLERLLPDRHAVRPLSPGEIRAMAESLGGVVAILNRATQPNELPSTRISMSA